MFFRNWNYFLQHFQECALNFTTCILIEVLSISEENTPDKNTDNIMTIHQVEPVTMNNGYANHNNHNNKIMNGSLKSCTRNGYITPHPPINITNNPLAPESKHEKVSHQSAYSY